MPNALADTVARAIAKCGTGQHSGSGVSFTYQMPADSTQTFGLYLESYDGAMLHSGDILSPEKLASDPATGRLTLNGFFTSRRKVPQPC